MHIPHPKILHRTGNRSGKFLGGTINSSEICERTMIAPDRGRMNFVGFPQNISK
jgi:hypothetical protein